MKKNVTYVDQAKFLALVDAAQGKYTIQSGFIRVDGLPGCRLYIARTKRVGRVDISGFMLDGAGVTELGAEAFCRVKQQLDFSLCESDILATFSRALVEMGLNAGEQPPAGLTDASAEVPSAEDADLELLLDEAWKIAELAKLADCDGEPILARPAKGRKARRQAAKAAQPVV